MLGEGGHFVVSSLNLARLKSFELKAYNIKAGSNLLTDIAIEVATTIVPPAKIIGVLLKASRKTQKAVRAVKKVELVDKTVQVVNRLFSNNECEIFCLAAEEISFKSSDYGAGNHNSFVINDLKAYGGKGYEMIKELFKGFIKNDMKGGISNSLNAVKLTFSSAKIATIKNDSTFSLNIEDGDFQGEGLLELALGGWKNFQAITSILMGEDSDPITNSFSKLAGNKAGKISFAYEESYGAPSGDSDDNYMFLGTSFEDASVSSANVDQGVGVNFEGSSANILYLDKDIMFALHTDEDFIITAVNPETPTPQGKVSGTSRTDISFTAEGPVGFLFAKSSDDPQGDDLFAMGSVNGVKVPAAAMSSEMPVFSRFAFGKESSDINLALVQGESVTILTASSIVGRQGRGASGGFTGGASLNQASFYRLDSARSISGSADRLDLNGRFDGTEDVMGSMKADNLKTILVAHDGKTIGKFRMEKASLSFYRKQDQIGLNFEASQGADIYYHTNGLSNYLSTKGSVGASLGANIASKSASMEFSSDEVDFLQIDTENMVISHVSTEGDFNLKASASLNEGEYNADASINFAGGELVRLSATDFMSAELQDPNIKLGMKGNSQGGEASFSMDYGNFKGVYLSNEMLASGNLKKGTISTTVNYDTDADKSMSIQSLDMKLTAEEGKVFSMGLIDENLALISGNVRDLKLGANIENTFSGSRAELSLGVGHLDGIAKMKVGGHNIAAYGDFDKLSLKTSVDTRRYIQGLGAGGLSLNELDVKAGMSFEKADMSYDGDLGRFAGTINDGKFAFASVADGATSIGFGAERVRGHISKLWGAAAASVDMKDIRMGFATSLDEDGSYAIRGSVGSLDMKYTGFVPINVNIQGKDIKFERDLDGVINLDADKLDASARLWAFGREKLNNVHIKLGFEDLNAKLSEEYGATKVDLKAEKIGFDISKIPHLMSYGGVEQLTGSLEDVKLDMKMRSYKDEGLVSTDLDFSLNIGEVGLAASSMGNQIYLDSESFNLRSRAGIAVTDFDILISSHTDLTLSTKNTVLSHRTKEGKETSLSIDSIKLGYSQGGGGSHNMDFSIGGISTDIDAGQYTDKFERATPYS